ncbi:MAG: YbjQ family protein [Oscillospiraceae bacterium]|nr:YbjQ family protein [Oscillospiraceae bacterium]MCL2321533.1 YbjQ family protein [Oscillospiraceae bacterium]
MDLATTDYIAGKELEHLGLVQGNIVLTKHIGQDIMAGLKAIVGGEIIQFTELLKEARTTATERMIQEAQNLGADAIITIRYSTAQIMDPAAEVMAYGTAVRYKK